jgi:hypothetical protein
LPDPQTNGGLLFSVNPGAKEEIVQLLRDENLSEFIEPIGCFVKREEKVIVVKK